MKSLSIWFAVFSLLVLSLTGCQGKLNLIVTNSTADAVSVIADGKNYSITSGADIQIPAPYDQQLAIKASGATYVFHIPLNPRPYSLNDYVDVHLIARLKITAVDKIVIVPKTDAGQGAPDKVLKGVTH